MKSNLPGLAVTIAGLLLAGGGGYAMWTGWDMILIERGWSLFIAGAAALSGGVVTVALGQVIAHLARLARPAVVTPAESGLETPGVAAGAPPESALPSAAAEQAAPAQPAARTPAANAFAKTAPNPKPEARPAPANHAPATSARRSVGAAELAVLRALEKKTSEPTEVDRYTAGDATYVMMSDGSVEVHSADGVQRYASLAALKAETAMRR